MAEAFIAPLHAEKGLLIGENGLTPTKTKKLYVGEMKPKAKRILLTEIWVIISIIADTAEGIDMELDELRDRLYAAYYHMRKSQPAHSRLHLLHCRRMLELAAGFHPDIDNMLAWINEIIYDLQHRWWSASWRMDAIQDLEDIIHRASAWCECKMAA